jgi:hypothetical protein
MGVYTAREALHSALIDVDQAVRLARESDLDLGTEALIDELKAVHQRLTVLRLAAVQLDV